MRTFKTFYASFQCICAPLLDTEGLVYAGVASPHQQRLVRSVAFCFARRRPVLPCVCKRAYGL